MESFARENAELENDAIQAKSDLMKEKTLENLYKLKKDSLNTEISLIKESVEATNMLIEEAKADGEDLQVELVDKISYQDERSSEGQIELS